MAFQAQRVRVLAAQQMFVVAAVRLVAGRASLLECRLVQMRLLALVRLIGMAAEAGAYRIRLQQSRRLAGMRIVAGDAVSLRSRMLAPSPSRSSSACSLWQVTQSAFDVGVGQSTTLPSFAG